MKKRILLLSHIPPYPAVGGDHIRICQTVDFLTRHFRVDLAYISHRQETQSQKSFNSSIENEFCFYVPPVTKVLQAARTLINKRALAVNLYDNRALRQFMSARAHDYDCIFCASAVMAQYAMRINDVKAFLDMTDSLALNRESNAVLSKGIRQRILKEEALRLARYETEALKHFYRTAYISDVDAAFIHEGNKCIIGNSVFPIDEADCCRHNQSSHNIVFVGIMNYEPNVTAVNFFAREVMPLIRRSIADASFTIAGKSPSPKVKELASLDGVTVSGFVESLTPLYRDYALVVAPMLTGSGVQNKILQAMAHGCCVLTTPKGTEGIMQLSDALVVCKPDAQVMADAVIRLINQTDERKRIGELARNRVSEEFGQARTDAQYRLFLGL